MPRYRKVNLDIKIQLQDSIGFFYFFAYTNNDTCLKLVQDYGR